MQYVTKAFTSFSEFYREINPATLSGAIDVIVVRHADGHLSCSPFHVRFGKLQILRPQDKVVDVYVNGEICSFKMKLGEAGEAFFVCETTGEDAVPLEYATSPIVGALDQGTLMSDGVDVTDVDQLDLDGQVEQVVDQYDVHDSVSGFVSARGSDFEIDAISALVAPTGPVEDIPEDREAEEIEDMNEAQLLPNRQFEGIATARTDEAPALQAEENSALDESRAARLGRMRTFTDPAHFDKDEFEHYGATSDSELDRNATVGTKPRHAPTDSMLDMHHRIPHVQGPKSDTELDDYAYLTPSGKRVNNEWVWGWGNLPRKDDGNEWVDPVLLAERQQLDAAKALEEQLNPKEIELGPAICYNSPGEAEQRFAMSLCGISAVDGVDRNAAHRAFCLNFVAWEMVDDNPGLLADPNLIVYDGSRFYPWSVFLPHLVALSMFGRPLSDASLQKLANAARPKIPDAPMAVDARKSRWRFWSRSSDVAQPTLSATDIPQTVESAPGTFSSPSRAPTFISELTMVTPPPVSEATPIVYYVKSLRLTSEQLSTLNLKPGSNSVVFRVSASSGRAYCAAKLFLWEWDAKIVISDIDGTITRSDALGHLFTMVGKDWTHMGVAKLYTDIFSNGYHIMYLTSRAIGQADATRDYLKTVKQGVYQLPEGPVIMSPDRLFTSFHREVILRRPELFKMACLRDIAKLFNTDRPFYSGFGNRITDALSYRSVDVPTSRIFTIDYNGEVRLELTDGFKSSYTSLHELVDHIFPPFGEKADETFNDFNYWKQPLVEVELPIPATSPKSSTAVSPQRSPSGTFSMFSFRGRVSPMPDLEMGTFSDEVSLAQQRANDGQEDDVAIKNEDGEAEMDEYAADLDDMAASIDFSEHPY